MITILTMLEEGYESSFEHLAFRQLRGAYDCKLICVPHDYLTIGEAIDSTEGTLVFMVPRGRVLGSTEFEDFRLPMGDITFVFGSPQENLVGYTGDHTALHISTKNEVDMMAVCVAAQVLYVHG